MRRNGENFRDKNTLQTNPRMKVLLLHNTVAAEQSLHSPPPSKRPHNHHNERSRKKQKLASSEIETHTRVEICKTNSTCTFTSEVHRHAISCDFMNQKGQRKKKPRKSSSQRQWTYSNHDVSSYKNKFVVISYNILGVDNVEKHPELYRRVSPRHLDWEYRKKLLCREVKRYQPSILCFQEVDRFNDLNVLLGKDGFTGVHKARSGEACDGCSIFWKSELFTLLYEENIEFQSFGLRNNVAQFCVLKLNQNLHTADGIARFPRDKTSRSLLVGNIHVLYNPKRGDIKLGQMRLFLQKAYELSQEWGCIPSVLTGDLNSLPQSAMYQYLASFELNILQHDRREISGQTCQSDYAESRSWSYHIRRPLTYRWTDEEMMLATGSRVCYLRHHLKISSAYANIPGSSQYRDKCGEPQATSHHCMFTGTVDYIWHTPDLFPIRVLETLPMHSLRKTGGLPNKKWGSDHLALVCELAFANNDD